MWPGGPRPPLAPIPVPPHLQAQQQALLAQQQQQALINHNPAAAAASDGAAHWVAPGITTPWLAFPPGIRRRLPPPSVPRPFLRPPLVHQISLILVTVICGLPQLSVFLVINIIWLFLMTALITCGHFLCDSNLTLSARWLSSSPMSPLSLTHVSSRSVRQWERIRQLEYSSLFPRSGHPSSHVLPLHLSSER